MVGEHASRALLLSLFDLREPAVRFLEGRGVVRDDAEDIFQDALVAFQEGLHRFDPNYKGPGDHGGNGSGNGNGNGKRSSEHERNNGNGNGGRPTAVDHGRGNGSGHAGREAVEMVDEDDLFLQVKRRARHWFWGILRNKTRAHLRGRGRWVHRVPERSQDAPDHFVIRIPEILSRLPSSEAEVLVLRFMHGADLALVARHCGVSVPTAHRRVKRALEAARAEL